MGMLKACVAMFATILVVWWVAGTNPRAAYRILAHSQQLFEPEHEVVAERPVARPKTAQLRQYLSPFTKKANRCPTTMEVRPLPSAAR